MNNPKARNAAAVARPKSADYLKLVEWSDEDGCYVGSAPPLVGPSCHGSDAAQVFRQISEIVEEHLKIREEDGLPIPPATLQKDYSGKFVLRVGPALHKALAIRATLAGDGLNEFCVKQLDEAATARTGSNLVRCALLDEDGREISHGMFQNAGGQHVACFLPLPRTSTLEDGVRRKATGLRFTTRLTLAIAGLEPLGNGSYQVLWPTRAGEQPAEAPVRRRVPSRR